MSFHWTTTDGTLPGIGLGLGLGLDRGLGLYFIFWTPSNSIGDNSHYKCEKFSKKKTAQLAENDEFVHYFLLQRF